MEVCGKKCGQELAPTIFAFIFNSIKVDCQSQAGRHSILPIFCERTDFPLFIFFVSDRLDKESRSCCRCCCWHCHRRREHIFLHSFHVGKMCQYGWKNVTVGRSTAPTDFTVTLLKENVYWECYWELVHTSHPRVVDHRQTVSILVPNSDVWENNTKTRGPRRLE